MTDLISRQAAIALADTLKDDAPDDERIADAVMAHNEGILEYQTKLSLLPPAQSEIIRCKDCKYQDENWRRVSVRWLPCMDVQTGGNWYCGSAERRQDE